jgi:hypothetical protein
MTWSDPFRSLRAWLLGRVGRRREEQAFRCGDCERRHRCGLPPSDQCIERAAALERGDWQLHRASWPTSW